MKIGIYIENYRAGGFDRVVIDKINHWPSKIDEFVLFCNDTHAGLPMIKKEIKRNVQYVTYRTSFYLRNYERLMGSRILFQINRVIYNTVVCYVAMLWEVPKLLWLFRRHKLDALMIHNGGWPAARSTRSAAIASKLVGIKKILFIIHGLAQPCNFVVKFQEYVIGFILSKIGITFVTVSNVAKSCLERYSCLSHVNVIHNGIQEINGVPSQSNVRNKIRAELGIDQDSFVVAMFGTYDSYRGHDFMIMVMRCLEKSIPKSILLVSGTGSETEKKTIMKMISSAGMNKTVFLLGFRDDVLNIMCESDVIVNPVQEYESFGLVAVEAMAMKKPVVVTKVGGNCEVVEDGVTGYIVPRDDPSVFAEKIVKLARDPNLRDQMGLAGYERYQKYFRASRMANDYFNCINQNDL